MVQDTKVFPLKNPETSLFEASLESASIMLREVVGYSLGSKKEDVPIKFVAGRQHFRAWAQQGAGKLKLPALALQISNIRTPEEGYNAFAMRHLGIGDRYQESEQHITKYHLRPLYVTCLVRFVCQNYEDVLKFSQGWISQLRRAFYLEGKDGFEIGIGLKTERNLDVPEEELDDIGSIFTIETSVVIQTFTGDIKITPTIQKIRTSLYVASFNNDPIKDASVITDQTGSYLEMPS